MIIHSTYCNFLSVFFVVPFFLEKGSQCHSIYIPCSSYGMWNVIINNYCRFIDRSRFGLFHILKYKYINIRIHSILKPTPATPFGTQCCGVTKRRIRFLHFNSTPKAMKFCCNNNESIEFQLLHYKCNNFQRHLFVYWMLFACA